MAYENLKSTGIKYLLGKLKTVFLQIKDAVKSVNGNEPDENGDITLNSVPYAQNLESESSHRSEGTFIQRTSGGTASIDSGDAWLMVLRGNNTHEGYVAEELNMEVVPIDRETPITAVIDRDVFVSYVLASGTINLVYSTAWNLDPTLYGITVTGTPVAGDAINIVYVKEERGTITVANPQKFVSTGWNLYNHTDGYAKVVKYEHGYRIDGTYSSIKFAQTPTGTQSDIIVTDGNFDIPSDGYVIVTGGNSSNTAVYAVWEDLTDGYSGSFQAYSKSEVDLSDVMSTNFPSGLMKAGSVVDEIDLNLGQAISRVDRMSYSAENLAIAKGSGREFEYDENYIYLARASASVVSISVNGVVASDDHGIEYFEGTEVPVVCEILYGTNLKNKLERDVLTLSSQELTAGQINQVQRNIGNQFFRVRPTQYSGTLASVVADANTLPNGIYLYFIGKQIVADIFGGSYTNAGILIATKTSDNWMNIFVSNGEQLGTCSVNLTSGAVSSDKYSTNNVGVTGTSTTVPDKTIPSGADTEVGYFDVPAGDYMIIITANFASNSSGYRSVWLSSTEGGSQLNLASRVVVAPANGINTRFQLPVTYSSASASRIHLVAYQNSGSSLAMNARYSIARIR